MSNIGTPMTSTIPAVGAAGTAYATLIDAFLTEVQGRLEAQVPLSSVLVSTLDMQNNGFDNVEYLGLYAQTSTPSTPVGSLQMYGGELYFVSASGAVKITAAGAVNAAAIGGFTGNYGGANPAQARFVDADTEYYFYDDYGLGKWAYVQGRAFDITGAITGSARVRLTWAGSSSYTLTVPTTPPAATKILQMGTTGTLTATNTLGTDQDLTLVGTAQLKRGDTTTAYDWDSPIATGAWSASFSGGGLLWSLAASSSVYVPMDAFPQGARIKSLRFSQTGGNVTTFELFYADYNLTTTALAFTQTVPSGFLIDLAVNAPVAMGSGNILVLKVSNGAGAATADFVNAIRVTYDIP